MFQIDSNGRIEPPIVESYAAGMVDDHWYTAFLTWNPILQGGQLVLDVVDISTGTSMGGFTLNGFDMPLVTQFGFGTFNDRASFDNVLLYAEHIPEPCTMTLLALGGVGALVRRRRRR